MGRKKKKPEESPAACPDTAEIDGNVLSPQGEGTSGESEASPEADSAPEEKSQAREPRQEKVSRQAQTNQVPPKLWKNS